MPSKFPTRDIARKEFSRLFATKSDEGTIWAFIHTPASALIKCGVNYLDAQRQRGLAVRVRMAELRKEVGIAP